nr:hypothetical protein GCM10017745_00970 [Saccharothrix mutabilis subsp. capreolus]
MPRPQSIASSAAVMLSSIWVRTGRKYGHSLRTVENVVVRGWSGGDVADSVTSVVPLRLTATVRRSPPVSIRFSRCRTCRL